MSPARKRFTVWKVNLVEQPGWAPWDPAGDIAEKAFLMTSEFMEGMKEAAEYNLLVEEMAGDLYKPKAPSGPQEWTPRYQLTGDDIEVLSKGLLEADPALELTRQLIVDAATWMYEAALIPSDTDARDALIDAKRAVEETFDLGEMPDPWELGYDNLWAPLLTTGITLNGILSEMMGMGISYVREEGHYDRFLEFDLNKASSPSMLLEEGHVPKEDRNWVIRSIEFDWKRLAGQIVDKFFQILSKDMKGRDPDNRTSWRFSWKAALKTADLTPIRKEMLDYVRDVRKREGSRL
jgi:hypothetical protein